jgi:hypothetical protein
VGPSVWTAKGTSLNRLTQSYEVGAISGTATIIAAVVAFVMLVSLQTLQEWPISGLGLGNGDDRGAARAPGPSAPAANQTQAAAVTRGASPGATQTPTGAPGTARNGHAGLGGGSAVAGGNGDVSTDAPTASPISESSQPSDAGSAAPVGTADSGASPGSDSDSGSEGAAGAGSGPVSRSPSSLQGAPAEEAVAAPTGQGHGASSAASENAGKGHGASSAASENADRDHGPHGGAAKAATPSKPVFDKAKTPTSKPSPSSTSSVPGPKTPKSAPPPAAGNAAPGRGAGE